MECPLCAGDMVQRNSFFYCVKNELHVLSAIEVQRYQDDDVDLQYLRHRAKVRMGKIIRGR